MNSTLRKALSVISGVFGVFSALLWHLSSNAQMTAINMSNQVAGAKAIAKMQEAVHNSLSVTENNWAAICAVIASISTAIILFYDE